MTEQPPDHLIPSQHLPTLSPHPPPSQLRTSLDRLQRLVAPHQIIIDLRSTSSGLQPSLNPDLATLDAFELNYARQWLERLVSLGSRRLVRVEDEEEAAEWEGLVEGGSYVLGRLMGGSASGGSEQVFLLPSPLGQEFEPLRIRIRETTLLSSSTGFRTWASATLLAHRIASNPFDYLPTTTATTTTTISDSEPVAAVQIMELGSGTGLVGLSLIATLLVLGIRSEVDLTDHEDSVLENLRRNLDRFRREGLDEEEAVVGGRVSKLDWSDHQSDSGSIRCHTKEEVRKVYDLIVAADVIYEPDHVELIHSTVAAFLRQPDPRSTRFEEGGTFHLALPLRSTHGLEMEMFEKTFPRVSSERDGRKESGGGGGGGAWRLAIVDEELVRAEKGDDGFGSGNEVQEYRLVRIRWALGEEMEGV